MTMEERVSELERIVSEMQGEGSYTSKYSGEEIDALLDKVAAMDGAGHNAHHDKLVHLHPA